MKLLKENNESLFFKDILQNFKILPIHAIAILV